MRSKIFLLLFAIIFGLNTANAQSDSNAKNLYYGYIPRSEPRRRQPNNVSNRPPTSTANRRPNVVSTANNRNNSRPVNQNSNRNSSTVATNQNNSSGVSPTPTGLPGTKITIELLRNGKLSFVKPTYKFKSGDKIRLRLKTNFEGFVSVLNIGSSGKINLLFPVQGVDNYVTPTADYQIPRDNGWIVFDNQPGTETISVIMSTEELDDLSSLDRNSDYFRKDRTTKDLYLQTSGNDFYAVFRRNEDFQHFGFTLKLRHKK
jgi:hypothetical protein